VGVAPLYFSSGGRGKNVQNKNQGNRGLSSVLYLLAMQQVHVNTKGQARNLVLRAYFKSKVSAGMTKIQALLCIMRRLINILYSMMKNNTVYRMPELLATEVTGCRYFLLVLLLNKSNSLLQTSTPCISNFLQLPKIS